MYAFAARTDGYKAGVILFFFAFVVFIIGFGAPYWGLREYAADVAGVLKTTYYHDGPFMECQSGDGIDTSCDLIGISGLGAWLHAVRTLECLCLIGLAIAAVYAIAVNCCKKWPGDLLRVLEIVAGVSGLIGFIGVIVYVGSVQTQPAATIISNISSFTFDWALYFAAIGSGLVVVAAIIIALYNVDHSDAYQGKGRPAVDLPYMGQPGDPTQSNDYWAAPNAHVFHNKRDRFHSRDYLVVNSGTSSSGDPWSDRTTGNVPPPPVAPPRQAPHVDHMRGAPTSSPWWVRPSELAHKRNAFAPASSAPSSQSPAVLPIRSTKEPKLPRLFGYDRPYSYSYQHTHFDDHMPGYGNPALY